MIPVEQNLKCYKGSTYAQNLYFKANGEIYPLTNIAEVRAQIRPSENSQTLIAEFDTELFASEGKISLGLSAEVTAGFINGAYFWDLMTVDENGSVQYWIKGKFVVSGRVTV